ncbi:hypothetical protein FC697_23360 [Bacillus wiedmannii]|uniref:insecticidal delta-endotoxin Cry8Ea1 family protein n=1 Tax=Bacillus wiedmannii TaxID=1890302 RepID=UPI0010BDFD0A|nr:insecticidal delta-endotoxin Cry8Ea1 family protein [Bacillus wiedmannii]TKH15934.1 hypothetical protein FC697_23360 [Bacillus wiedmannii]
MSSKNNNNYENIDNNEENELSVFSENSDNTGLKELNPNNITPLLVNPLAIISMITMIKDIAGAIGSGKTFLTEVYNILWPVDAAQKRWEEFIQFAEELISERIADYAKLTALDKLQGLKDVLVIYQEKFKNWEKDPNNTTKMEEMRIQFTNTRNAFAENMPQLATRGYEVHLLPTFTAAANLYLILLRDASIYGSRWGLSDALIEDIYKSQKTKTIEYTDYCITTYNNGLTKAKSLKANLGDTNKYPWLFYTAFPNPPRSVYQATEDWNLFNEYRRSMTIAVLDFVRVWPLYDYQMYPNPVEFDYTRSIYSNVYGIGNDTFDKVENQFTQAPDLLKNLNEVSFHLDNNIQSSGSVNIVGVDHRFDKYGTLETIWDPRKGKFGNGGSFPIYLYPNTNLNIHHYAEASIITGPGQHQIGNSKTRFGVFSNFNFPEHSISYVTPIFPGYAWVLKGNIMRSVGFTMKRGKPDPRNILNQDTNLQKISQFSAVRGYLIDHGATVVKGPGSTGGDLIKLPPYNDQWTQYRIRFTDLNITRPMRYKLRIRYACDTDSNIFVAKYVPGDSTFRESTNISVRRTFVDNMNYNSFQYLNLENDLIMFADERIFNVELRCNSGNVYIDKIEFIPVIFPADPVNTDFPPDLVNTDFPADPVNTDFPPDPVNTDFPANLVNTDFPPDPVNTDFNNITNKQKIDNMNLNSSVWGKAVISKKQ